MKDFFKLRTEEHGAGEEGTPEIVKKYADETPGQTEAANRYSPLQMAKAKKEREERRKAAGHDKETQSQRMRRKAYGNYMGGLKKESIDPIIAEELKVSDGVAKWITDFKDSDAPQFQGKSDEEKKKMAIAAFMAAKAKEGGKKEEGYVSYAQQKAVWAARKDGGKGHPDNKKKTTKESVEQLDELDAKTQQKFVAGAKNMKAYAMKNGGIDKADFMKVAKSLETISRINLLQAGQELAKLNRMVDGMDTDVRERIYVELKKVGLVESNEEIGSELNEAKDPPLVMNAIASAKKALQQAKRELTVAKGKHGSQGVKMKANKAIKAIDMAMKEI